MVRVVSGPLYRLPDSLNFRAFGIAVGAVGKHVGGCRLDSQWPPTIKRIWGRVYSQ
jgi:hypothetical protein